MRSKKALFNTITGLLYEAVVIICSFILPKLILSGFGSEYNGITNSISQFLGYVALLKAGIGGVTKAALYKPLANKSKEEISGVINATDRFLKKVSVIFALSLVAFAAIYPLFVLESFDWVFSFTLVLIIGVSTFMQYFFGLTYQLLLNADQRQSFIYIIQIATTLINTFAAWILIKFGATIHIVKLASSLIFIMNPVLINIYARRKYKIDKTIPPNNEAIRGKWDCFGLQVANFINSNTDIVVLTIFRSLFEVSIYTVYHMVTSGLRQILNTFVNGVGAAFGNMFAKGEHELISKNLLIFEEIVFSLANFFFSVCIIMIVPFVTIYTKNIVDTNYVQYPFAYVLTVAILFTCYRIPYQAIVEAVGHFKQTRNGAFFEAFLNISVSIVCVIFLGLVGVAIGTLAAAIFRTFQYSIYVSKNIVKRSIWILIKRLALSLVVFAVVFLSYYIIKFEMPTNFGIWVLQSLLFSAISLATILIIEIIFYRKVFISLCTKIKAIAFKKRKKETQGC